SCVTHYELTIVGATYAPGVPNPSWALGDFDYNGFVDDDDVTLLGAFYDPSAVSLPSPLDGTTRSQPMNVSAIPEPSTLAVLLVAVLLGGVALLHHRARVGWKRANQP